MAICGAKAETRWRAEDLLSLGDGGAHFAENRCYRGEVELMGVAFEVVERVGDAEAMRGVKRRAM